MELKPVNSASAQLNRVVVCKYLKAFWDGDEDLAFHGVLPEVPGEDPVHMHPVRHVHLPLGESGHKQIGSLGIFTQPSVSN